MGRRIGVCLLCLVLCWISASTAAASDQAALPAWQPLLEHADPALQARLEQAVARNPSWRRLAERRKLAIGLVDMHGESPRFARINGGQMMYAASLPKIAILLGGYASFEDGSLAETDALHQDLKAMIQVSSNDAATRLIDVVGMRKIQAVLQDPRFGFYDESRGGGLWVGKRYARSGPRVGDPVNNISHGATATQVCRFYYLASTGRLINPARSAQIMEDLADPRLHHKFVAAIDKRAPLARVFRKSGTWRDWHSDSVLVQGPLWRNYILVGLVESSQGEQILRDLLPVVEGVIEAEDQFVRR
jgi:beta-lactamase class A